MSAVEGWLRVERGSRTRRRAATRSERPARGSPITSTCPRGWRSRTLHPRKSLMRSREMCTCSLPPSSGAHCPVHIDCQQPTHRRRLAAPGKREVRPCPGAVTTPANVHAQRTKPVWRFCTRRDDFPAAPGDLVSGRFCPFCAGKQAKTRTCSATTHPYLVCETGPERPDDPIVARASNLAIQFACPQRGAPRSVRARD